MNERWKHYIPAIFMVLLAMFFIAVPVVAAFIVSTAIGSFAAIYAFIIYRLHKIQDQVGQQQGGAGQTGFEDVGDPTFRNVSFFIARRGKIFRDLN